MRQLNDTPNRVQQVDRWTVGLWSGTWRAHLRIWRDGQTLSQGQLVKAGSVWVLRGDREFDQWVHEVTAGVD